MKIRTDPHAESFTAKNTHIFTKTTKKVISLIMFFTLIIGSVEMLTGCSNTNLSAEKLKEMQQAANAQIIDAYKNGTLSELEIEQLGMAYAPIDSDFIKQLPTKLIKLNLLGNPFICSLEELPYACPNLESLKITDCYRIINFDFVKEMTNLKEFYISGDTIGITQDLIDYLNQRGINHNLSEYHIELDQKVQAIVDSIITDDMDEEKITQEIVKYVIKNMKYDKSVGYESMDNPLQWALKGKGVCQAYAAFTQALLTKAGIETYTVMANEHMWNLVKLDGKYHYIDTTNIYKIPFLTEWLFNEFNINFGYKQDPYNTTMSAMTDLDKLQPLTPEKLLILINEANDEKTFIEKYGSNLYLNLMALLGILIGLGIIKIGKNLYL